MSEPNAQPMHDSVVHPEFIGGYRIRSLIGEGGFGYVYLAEQSKPVRRLVALKVLKPGVDSPRAIARFQAEQQALALMEHVNVAHVYDAGVTEHGRPYFAMEYIDGLSIIDYCNRARMTIDDRIRLFIAVCDGVQHAHARGIIHRDLKPTNIVVSTVTTPTPKVIDFGIAKAIDGNMADAADTINMADMADLTQNGQLIGTATYASPEQIMGVIDGIDTRTDVYSLGIVLAELLAGALPLDLRGLRGALLTQTAVFADPTLPSAIPDSMPPERAQLVAADRSTTVQALKNALRGDIDAIVSKAIEKEPDQRYSSAIEMSADLVRALYHQPIRARHAGRIYRLRKFARRRKRTIVISSLISIALVCALGLAIFRSIDAADARGESFAAIKERADAQVAAVDMLELLVGLLRDEFTEAAPGTRRMDLKTRLQQISAGGSKLAIDERLEADLRLHLGRAFLSLRDFVRAENEATRCVDLASHEGLDDPHVRPRFRSKNRSPLVRRALALIGMSTLAAAAFIIPIGSSTAGAADQAVASLNESIDRSPARSVGHLAIVNAARTAKIDALLALGRPRDAELLAHELLAAQITVLPPGHRWIAATRSALGESLYLQGRGEEAEPLLVSSDAMLSAALSSESELVRASRRRLDELTRRLGRPVRATPELPPLTAERRAVDNTDKN